MVCIGIVSVITGIPRRAIGERQLPARTIIAGRVFVGFIGMSDDPSAVLSAFSAKIPSLSVEISSLRNVLWGCENPLWVIIWIKTVMSETFISVLTEILVNVMLLFGNFGEISCKRLE